MFRHVSSCFLMFRHVSSCFVMFPNVPHMRRSRPENGHEGIVKLLLLAKCDTETEGVTALMDACFEGHDSCARVGGCSFALTHRIPLAFTLSPPLPWSLTRTVTLQILLKERTLTTHYAPLTTHHSRLTAHNSLLTTHYSSYTTHHTLLTLTTHYSLLTTHCSLLTTHCSLLTTYYSLLTTH